LRFQQSGAFQESSLSIPSLIDLEMNKMHPNAEKVQKKLNELGYTGSIFEMAESTRTAAEAAQAAGCEVGQIVKSLLFKLQRDGSQEFIPILVLVSGTNRVHEKRLGHLLEGTLLRADADYVHEVSGFAIGGVPPVGHKTTLETYIDEDLLQYDAVWAAAGTSNAIFQIKPARLVEISKSLIVCVK
jgi:prolyl-tRNA editing enzyme YbaK/EbsC (Cys-tRNA(Pro) deacylase)